ncbi:unnamed protein product [Euphydryas editha]|uniref:Reverse transcriptase domain-containing protein n=1 Tax=Euphydryas editha TaxID=104508 RepID=A0AAU9TKL2_EUPED|nr:unnamed protein product [Euphydryas editha]
MLAKNIIEPCSSAWTAPMRVCVDYRRLNSITKPDIYPIPRIDDLLHAAKPTPFMSTLDLRAGYWQVKVKESDQDKTSFITPFGVYRFKRMAFGLRNAPTTFQRLIDRVRISLDDVKMLAYLDDILLFSSSFTNHLQDLDKLLRKLKEVNLHVNLKKCNLLLDYQIFGTPYHPMWTESRSRESSCYTKFSRTYQRQARTYISPNLFLVQAIHS